MATNLLMMMLFITVMVSRRHVSPASGQSAWGRDLRRDKNVDLVAVLCIVVLFCFVFFYADVVEANRFVLMRFYGQKL